jgi:hypothetical protein
MMAQVFLSHWPTDGTFGVGPVASGAHGMYSCLIRQWEREVFKIPCLGRPARLDLVFLAAVRSCPQLRPPRLGIDSNERQLHE